MKTVVAAAIGECVHVAGVTKFLRLAELAGWRTIFLGPATPIGKVIQTAIDENADMVGVSYRLTPENGERLLGEFAEEASQLHQSGVRFLFGGTPPLVERVEKLGFFEACFNGKETNEQVMGYLRDQTKIQSADVFPQKTIERIKWKAPFPLIRHHFGLPDFNATLAGIQQIADAGVIDVISLGIDQDAQENFFHPERQDKRRRGAGGVPVRSPDDYRRLFEATRHGNYPLLRTYTGTDDFIRLAEMYVDTINMAWAAIPLYWFNQMDGRGPWDLEGSIEQHQKLMAWYGERHIPVEANEAHHWGMRDAPDEVFVVSAYLAGYNARAFGVQDHIVQMMFNSPPGTSDAMDLAKMTAVMRMIDELQRPDFRIWRQTRTGLLSYPVDEDRARAHLATSIYIQMGLSPHIVHVVGYPEADHAVTAEEVIASYRMARKAIENALYGQLDLTQLENVSQRADELIEKAKHIVDLIRQLSKDDNTDPLTDASVLTQAVTSGLLDAPQLINNPYASGKIQTVIDSRGACISLDEEDAPSIKKVDNKQAAMQGG